MGKDVKLLFLFSTIFCYLLLDFHVKSGTRVLLRDERLFEINEGEITRIDCIVDVHVAVFVGVIVFVVYMSV